MKINKFLNKRNISIGSLSVIGITSLCNFGIGLFLLTIFLLVIFLLKPNLKAKFLEKVAEYTGIFITIVSATLLLGIIFFWSDISTDSQNIYFEDWGIPKDLREAGIDESYIKTEIIDNIRSIINNSPKKVSEILASYNDGDSTRINMKDVNIIEAEVSKDLVLFQINEDFTVNNQFFTTKRIRRLLGKKDFSVRIQLIELDDTILSKISITDCSRTHRNTLLKIATAPHLNNKKKCALELIKMSAAYITNVFSPLASVLYERNNTGVAGDYNQGGDLWSNNIYNQAERDSMLCNYALSDQKDSPYGYLALADYYEWLGIIKYTTFQNPTQRISALEKAEKYYKAYLDKTDQHHDIITRKKEEVISCKNMIKELRTSSLNSSQASIINQINKKYGFDTSQCQQLIIIKSNSERNQEAHMYIYEYGQKGWTEIKKLNSEVYVGLKGIKAVELKQEGDSCTPAGLFPISEAFGGEGNPNKNGLKYTLVSNQKNHKWVTKSGDKHYNTLVEDRTGKYGPKECEVLPGNNRAYQKYVIVIDHNTNPVVDGKGSAIFIHKSTREKGTLGCVSVRGTNSDAIMKQLTEWLDPKKEPHIYICVSE
ncbi:MAG: L,D-transpeptidase family protein [Prevotella sp.]|nr:L,D-transpeptidase family protein [Prevotella sp.]